MKLEDAKNAIKEIGRRNFEELFHLFGEEVMKAAMACDIPLDEIEEAYRGEHSSDEEFAQYLIEEFIEFDLPDYVYIDWKRTARDVMMDYCESNGHYFRIL